VAAVQLFVVDQLLVQLGQLPAQLDLLLFGCSRCQRRVDGGEARRQPAPPRHAGEHALDERAARQL
jgi:hypothetical protein